MSGCEPREGAGVQRCEAGVQWQTVQWIAEEVRVSMELCTDDFKEPLLLQFGDPPVARRFIEDRSDAGLLNEGGGYRCQSPAEALGIGAIKGAKQRRRLP